MIVPPSMFDQLYAMPTAEWPQFRRNRDGRIAKVATLVEGPGAYAIVEFDDDDQLAVPAHELDTRWTRADVDPGPFCDTCGQHHPDASDGDPEGDPGCDWDDFVPHNPAKWYGTIEG